MAFLGEEDRDAYLGRTELVSYTPKTIIEEDRLLKELKRTRQRGYSSDMEETVSGLACIGAPIFGRGGRLEGSLSLSGKPHRFQVNKIKGLSEKLIQTTEEISRSMGYLPEALRI